jgi:gliding motility-associated-like protein
LGIRLSWHPALGASAWLLERQTLPNGAWKQAAFLPPTDTTYLDQAVDPATTAYRYRISARDSCGGQVSAPTPATTLLLTATPNGEGARLNWTPYQRQDGQPEGYELLSAPLTYVNPNAVGSPRYTTQAWGSIPLAAPNLLTAGDLQATGDTLPGKAYRVYITNAATGYEAQSNTALIIPIDTVLIPTAFTPGNGDALNEGWAIRARGIAEAQAWVYTRRGQQVWAGNPLGQGWNGQCNGQTAQEGIYAWLIRYKTLTGAWKQRAGTVMVVR